MTIRTARASAAAGAAVVAAGASRAATTRTPAGRLPDELDRRSRRCRVARALRRRRALRLRVPPAARRRHVLPRAREGGAAPAASSSSAPARGRVTVPLARDGHRVVALDQSPAMLAEAARAGRASCRAAAAARITVVDRRPAHVRGRAARFPLVIAAFNVLEHLYTRGELARVPRSASRHTSRPAARSRSTSSCPTSPG